MSLILSCLILGFDAGAGVFPNFTNLFKTRACQEDLTGQAFADDREALEHLVKNLAGAYPDTYQTMPAYQVGASYLGPSLRLETKMIMGSLYGGPGLSSLFNALPELLAPNQAGDATSDVGVDPGADDVPGVISLSPTERWPGTTQRTILGRSDDRRARSNAEADDLHERLKPLGYGSEPWQIQSLRRPEAAKQPGDPVDVVVPNLPWNMVVADVASRRNGDPRVATGPSGRAAAESALIPADFAVIQLDANSIRDYDMLNDLRETGRRYGQKQLILTLRSDPGIPDEDATAMLTEAANIIMDRPVHARGVPDGVAGMYLNPHDNDVPIGRSHVKLRPLNGSPEFGDLLRQMAADPAKYKKFSIVAATRTLQETVGKDIRAEMKSRLVTQIYRQARRALIYTIAKENTKDFPFEEGERAWRNVFERRGSRGAAFTNRLSEWAGKPEHLIGDAAEGVGNLVRRFKKGKRSEVNDLHLQKVQADQIKKHPLYDQTVIMHLQNGLASGVLSLIEDPKLADRTKAGDQLKATIEEFYRLFPEERVDDVACPVEPGRVCVRLPSRQLLADVARREVEAVIQRNPGELLSAVRLQTEIPDLALTAENIASQLDAARKGYPLRKKMGNAAIDGLSVFALVTATGWMQAKIGNAGNLTFMLSYLAGTVPARYLRYWVEGRRDKGYRTRINAWFRGLQFETITNVLDGKILNNLENALEAPASDRSKHLREVQRALHHLDPEFKEFPDKIAVILKPAPAPTRTKPASKVSDSDS